MPDSPCCRECSEMNTKLLLLFFAIVSAQIMSWYQSNSMIMWEWVKQHSLPIIVITSPFIGILFAYATKMGYEVLESLWAIRFSAFAVGYLVFIILAWIHFDESPFTAKNMITTLLCFSLLVFRFFGKQTNLLS